MEIPVKEIRQMTIYCAVCGAKLELNKLNHYIARDSGTAGSLIAAISREPETDLYDAFDCPVCGSQYIAQERKRASYIAYGNNVQSDNATEVSDKTEEASDKEEKLECKGCEFEGETEGNPFDMECVNCRRLYTDKYRKKAK